MKGVQQAKTKETKKQEIDRAEDRTHCTRAKTVLVHSIFEPGRGLFIRELHPEQPALALWAKLNSAKFLCQYKV